MKKIIFLLLFVVGMITATNAQIFQKNLIGTDALQASKVFHGNINNDGIEDIIINYTYNEANHLVYRLGNGDGTFEPIQGIIDIGFSEILVKFADIDNDGWDDIFIAYEIGTVVEWRRNQHDGTFSGQNYIASPYLIKDFDIADVDGDGDIDFVITSAGDYELNLFKNNFIESGSNTVSFTKILIDNKKYGHIRFEYVNDDTLPDIIVSSFKESYADNLAKITIFTNTGSGNYFNTTNSFMVGDSGELPAINMYLLDYDNDGQKDLIYMYSQYNDAQSLHEFVIAVRYKISATEFGDEVNIYNLPSPQGAAMDGGYCFMYIENVLGDAYPEIIASSINDQKIVVLQKVGTSFTLAETFGTGLFTRDFTVANFDNAGYSDVIGVSSFMNLVYVPYGDEVNFYKNTSALAVGEYEIPGFNMYPNPTTDILNISTDEGQSLKVEIYNTLGQKVLKKNDVENSISLQHLKTEIYLAHITDNKGNRTARRIIKK